VITRVIQKVFSKNQVILYLIVRWKLLNLFNPYLLSDEKLAEIENILEFGIIAFLAWLISESVLDSLLKANFVLTVAVLGKWIAFFLTLLIYYKLIRVYVRVKKEV